MLSNIRFLQKIVLVLTVPLLAFGFLSLKSVREKQAESNDMQTVDQVAGISVDVSAFVHEMQKERGLAAGFLGSGGTAFRSELTEQRKAADRALDVLQAGAFSQDNGGFGSEFVRLVENAKNRAGRLESMRGRISSLDVPAAEAIAYYTDTNTALIDIIAYSSKVGGNAEIARRLTAYQSLILAKERAGIERAVVSGAFAAGRFADAAAYTKFVSLVAQQEAFFGAFLGAATSDQQSFYRTTLSGSVTDQVASLRTVAMDAGVGTAITADATAWFGAATRRIDALKVVEDRLASDMRLVSDEIRSAAGSAVRRTIIIALLSVGGAMALGFLVVAEEVRETGEGALN